MDAPPRKNKNQNNAPRSKSTASTMKKIEGEMKPSTQMFHKMRLRSFGSDLGNINEVPERSHKHHYRTRAMSMVATNTRRSNWSISEEEEEGDVFLTDKPKPEVPARKWSLDYSKNVVLTSETKAGVTSAYARNSRLLANKHRTLSVLSLNYALPVMHSNGLPAGVVNMDAKLPSDAANCGDIAQDIMTYMRDVEVHSLVSGQTPNSFKPKTRKILMDWIVQVQHHLGITQRSLYYTVSLTDRYIHRNSVQPSQYQLVGITSILIATKIEERYHADVRHLCYLTEDTYKKTDVLRMERQMLVGLDFRVHVAEPSFFLQRCLQTSGIEDKDDYKMIHQLSSYYIDTLLITREWSEQLPSKLAAAGFCLAIHATGFEKWTKTMEFYCGYSKYELKPLMILIAREILSSSDSKNAVFIKFSSTFAWCQVAQIEQVTSQNAIVKHYAKLHHPSDQKAKPNSTDQRSKATASADHKPRTSTSKAPKIADKK